MANLNKAELEALQKDEDKVGSLAKERELKERLKEMGTPSPEVLKKIFEKRNKKNKDGVISFEELEKMLKKETKVIEAAKGGEVKKYMGGGSVHKKKNKMITTRGWGASRKT
jgi:hypothetical protein